MASNTKHEIVERRFADHAEALIYTEEHYCATYPKQCGEEWVLFEIVPVESK